MNTQCAALIYASATYPFYFLFYRCRQLYVKLLSGSPLTFVLDSYCENTNISIVKSHAFRSRAFAAFAHFKPLLRPRLACWIHLMIRKYLFLL